MKYVKYADAQRGVVSSRSRPPQRCTTATINIVQLALDFVTQVSISIYEIDNPAFSRTKIHTVELYEGKLCIICLKGAHMALHSLFCKSLWIQSNHRDRHPY